MFQDYIDFNYFVPSSDHLAQFLDQKYSQCRLTAPKYYFCNWCHMHRIQNLKGIEGYGVNIKSLLSPVLQAHRPPVPHFRRGDCEQFLILPDPGHESLTWWYWPCFSNSIDNLLTIYKFKISSKKEIKISSASVLPP